MFQLPGEQKQAEGNAEAAANIVVVPPDVVAVEKSIDMPPVPKKDPTFFSTGELVDYLQGKLGEGWTIVDTGDKTDPQNALFPQKALFPRGPTPVSASRGFSGVFIAEKADGNKLSYEIVAYHHEYQANTENAKLRFSVTNDGKKFTYDADLINLTTESHEEMHTNGIPAKLRDDAVADLVKQSGLTKEQVEEQLPTAYLTGFVGGAKALVKQITATKTAELALLAKNKVTTAEAQTFLNETMIAYYLTSATALKNISTFGEWHEEIPLKENNQRIFLYNPVVPTLLKSLPPG